MVLLKKRKLLAAFGPAAKRSKSEIKATKSDEKSEPKATKSDEKSEPKATKSNKKKINTKTKASRQRVVDASSLVWKPVGEEFGGLEVITGVEVVRDGDKVQFVVKDAQDAQGGQDNKVASAAEEEESFEGFGDDVVENKDFGAGEAGSGQSGVEGEEPHYQDQDQGSTAAETKTSAPSEQGQQAKKSKQGEQRQQTEGRKQGEQRQQTKGSKPGEPGKQSRKQARAVDRELEEKGAGTDGGNAFEALAAVTEDGGAGDNDVDVAEWVALNLSTQMLSCVAGLKFSQPTRIQKLAIPEILAGEDVIGKAQTGSGKTLAFGIPIVEKWLEMKEGEEEDEDEKQETDAKESRVMAVVLSPTRELAKQLGDHIKALCRELPAAPRVCVVTGGLSIQKQQRQLARADVVIGTPGRLWEVMDGDAGLQESLSRAEFLVVDEADRLLQTGQFEEVESILGALDRRAPGDEGDEGDADLPPRQTLVFSATLDKDLQTKLAGKGRREGAQEDKMAYLMRCLRFRREPKFIHANPVRQLAANLKEGLIECGAMEKDLYLYSVLLLNPGRRTLVFTNSISAVRRLTPLLTHLGLNALPLHSQMAQKARLRSVERFSAAAPPPILVATDVAARGLDFPAAVDLVLHYHVPRTADAYIHRSGRTARAERAGASIVLCSPDEVLATRRLVAKVHAQDGRGGSGMMAAAAAAAVGGGKKTRSVMPSLPLNRQITARVKPRVVLAKKLADAVLAKEKARGEDTWLSAAAEELGVEYDADEFDNGAGKGLRGRGGRGGGRKKKEKEACALSKAEMGAIKAQLREELGRRVNLGVSEKYITGGRVDVAALIRGREGGVGGLFLGGEELGLGL